jgi:hypothetical protein
MAAVASREMATQKKQKGPITAASVPSDPGPTEVSQGTQAEESPFGGTIEFARGDVAGRVQLFPMTEVRLLPSVFREPRKPTANT